MPRHCLTCSSSAIDSVERDLAEGKLSLAKIGCRYGLSKSSLSRHRNNCMARRAWDVRPRPTPS
jgi:hypothetical protein